MTNAIIVKSTVTEAGLVANHHATHNLFDDYQIRKSRNTLRAQYADLCTFAEYLCAAGVDICPTGDELQNHPDAWRGATWGLVQGFVAWMLTKGLAVTTVNHKLSTVKSYAELAARAGVIHSNELPLINGVNGFAKKEFNRVDEKRATTRTSVKKAHSTVLRPALVQDLKTQPSTPQGLRVCAFMCLLLDHGLRAEEVSELKVTDIDPKAGILRVYRSKIQKAQTHRI
jgi:site-specific recombinase XerD